MYEVQHYRSNELPPILDGQAASFIRLVWNVGGTGDDRFWRLNDPSGEVEHFVVAERDTLISYVLLRRRTITHMGNTYRLFGLGGMMTYPAFRHEGHGARVAQAATAYLRHSDMDAGMLFTGSSLFPYYEPHGWVPLEREGVYYGDSNQPQFSDSHVMMLHVSDHARNHRQDFEQGDLFVGASLW